jgi:hypothetical protein
MHAIYSIIVYCTPIIRRPMNIYVFYCNMHVIIGDLEYTANVQHTVECIHY